MSKGKGVAWLLVGAAAGAVLGVLFAPRSGKETRTQLKDWLDEKREKSAELIEGLRAKLPEQRKKFAAAIKAGGELFKGNSRKEEPVEA